LQYTLNLYMKKLIILLCFCSFAGYAQKKTTVGKFTITGTLTGRDTGRVVLGYYNKNSKWTERTASLQQGKFSFDGVIDGVTFAKISGSSKSANINDPNVAPIFIEPNVLTVNLVENDFKHAVISGSDAQHSLDSLNVLVEDTYKELAPFDKQYSLLKLAYSNGDKSPAVLHSLQAMQLKIKPYLERVDMVYYHYVRTHPRDYLSAGIMNYYMVLSRIPFASATMLYDNLDAGVRSSVMGKEVYTKLQAIEENNRRPAPAVATISMTAPAFTKNDINGLSISLADYKGKKYVLLDFWATWCGPCKAFTPHLNEIYAKYAPKGLEVISISHDRNAAEWIAGVKEEKMDKWRNIYTGFDKTQNEIARQYGIEAIPTVILIDMDGKIVGRYVGTAVDGDIPQLKQQLAKLLK